MGKLQQIWQEAKAIGKQSDKGDIHSYIEVYEHILAPYQNCKKVLEIGLFNGHSLLMWEKYFTGEVYGIDCSETPHDGMADLRPLLKSHNISIMDACDKKQVKAVFKDFKFDVVIDDASHDLSQQLALYEVFKPYLNKGSIYIIEDIQDLDANEGIFRNMDDEKEITIVDNRSVKNRYDDALVIITDKIK